MDELRAYEDGFNLCPIVRSSRGRVMPEEEKNMRRLILQKAQILAQSPESKAKRAATRRSQNTLNQKLTWVIVQEIRQKYGAANPYGKGRHQRKNGGITLQSLAEEYNVDFVTIYDVVRYKTWKTEPQTGQF